MVGSGALLQSVIFIRGNACRIANVGLARVVGWNAVQCFLRSREYSPFSCSAQPDNPTLNAAPVNLLGLLACVRWL